MSISNRKRQVSDLHHQVQALLTPEAQTASNESIVRHATRKELDWFQAISDRAIARRRSGEPPLRPLPPGGEIAVDPDHPDPWLTDQDRADESALVITWKARAKSAAGVSLALAAAARDELQKRQVQTPRVFTEDESSRLNEIFRKQRERAEAKYRPGCKVTEPEFPTAAELDELDQIMLAWTARTRAAGHP